MLSIDYKQPLSRVRWNLWNRTVLCCMFRFFQKDKEAFRRVFESLFPADLKSFDHELPYGTLNTQWCDLRRHGDPVWHRVHICIAFPASGPWPSVISCIKERASSLGFSLVEKQVDDIDTSTFRLNPTRRRNRRDLLSDTYGSTPSSDNSPSLSQPSSSSHLQSSSPSWQVPSDQPGLPEVSDDLEAASPELLCTSEEEFCFDKNVNDCPRFVHMRRLKLIKHRAKNQTQKEMTGMKTSQGFCTVGLTWTHRGLTLEP